MAMELEKPCSPGHCLGMLNAHMRTDILKAVHEYVIGLRENNDRRSPLEMLMEGVQHTLSRYQHSQRYEDIMRNPFNMDEKYFRFDPVTDYQHDIDLLKSQLAGLQDLYDGIGEDYFKQRSKQ